MSNQRTCILLENKEAIYYYSLSQIVRPKWKEMTKKTIETELRIFPADEDSPLFLFPLYFFS